MGGISIILVKNHFFILLNKFNLHKQLHSHPKKLILLHPYLIAALAQMVVCLPLVQQDRGIDPRRGSKFSFENFQPLG